MYGMMVTKYPVTGSFRIGYIPNRLYPCVHNYNYERRNNTPF